MIQLFIIADDINGALDTSVQFSIRGAKTSVITDPYADISRVPKDVRVLVMNAETRHMSAKDAHDIVYRAVQQATLLRIPYIYKKVDSTLRGNVGAELSAMLQASGKRFLPFVPAYPKNGRVTRGGVQYVNGVPLAKSAYAKDPLAPVSESDVCDLIGQQSQYDAVSRTALRAGDTIKNERGIVVYDCETDDQMKENARRLMEADGLHIMAGCAGLAAALPELLGLSAPTAPVMPKLDKNFTVLCASVNSYTVNQMNYAEAHGFAHIRLEPKQKLTKDYFYTREGKAVLEDWKKIVRDNECVIFDTNSDRDQGSTNAWAEENGINPGIARQRVAASIGSLMKAFHDDPNAGTMLVTGGETLLRALNDIGVFALEPICELAPGVVLNRYTHEMKERYIISKSGFLTKDSNLMTEIHDKYLG